MMDRRFVLAGAAALPFANLAFAADDPFMALEQKIGGRLGVAALDTASGKRLEHRAGERFPMCSTFKLLAVAAVLDRIDDGDEKLGRFIGYSPRDLLDHSPITTQHIREGGMNVEELCRAAIEYSDNTAANLILATLDGPSGATRYVRSLGDHVTRIDRNEPSANTAIPGDPRDTTTPGAMLADLNTLAFGQALSADIRTRLVTWLTNYQTKFPRIAAGLPKGWTSAHKMGTGANGSTNDVAIIWPPGRPPILVAAYLTGSTAPDAELDATLAAVGRIVAMRL